VLIWLGLKEFELQRRSRAEPQVISCEKLLAQGPGDNLHIILTDFALLPDFVYEHEMDHWKGAWVPVVPRRELEVALTRTAKRRRSCT
jgi:hypothetical protein